MEQLEHTNTFTDKIAILSGKMAQQKQTELEINHFFAKGLYAREMVVPAGVLVASLVHRHETICVLSKGAITVWNEDGTKLKTHAPYILVCKPGSKIGYAVEDSVWTTFHHTNLTDLYEIEQEQFVIDPVNPGMFDFTTGKVKHQYLQDRADYDLLLQEYCLDRDVVRHLSELTGDLLNVPEEVLHVVVEDSLIEGKGVFPKKMFKRGDIIGFSLIKGMRTQLGRYVNHSCCPTAEVICLDNGDKILIALSDNDGVEITTDYRQTFESISFPVPTGGILCPV